MPVVYNSNKQPTGFQLRANEPEETVKESWAWCRAALPQPVDERVLYLQAATQGKPDHPAIVFDAAFTIAAYDAQVAGSRGQNGTDLVDVAQVDRLLAHGRVARDQSRDASRRGRGR